MNNQLGYNCNSCQRAIPAGRENFRLLDNRRGSKLSCVLCPTCDYTQYSSREQTNWFPLLEIQLKNADDRQEIKTSEFKRYEERIRLQQEMIKRNSPQYQSQFNCDKCYKPIPFTEEKEHYFTKYKENSSMVSNLKYCLLCPPCDSGLTKDMAGRIDEGEVRIDKSPTFVRYREYKENLKEENNSLVKKLN